MVDNWLRVSEGTRSQFRLQEPIPASGASRSGPKKFGNAKPLSHLGNQKRELCPSVGEWHILASPASDISILIFSGPCCEKDKNKSWPFQSASSSESFKFKFWAFQPLNDSHTRTHRDNALVAINENYEPHLNFETINFMSETWPKLVPGGSAPAASKDHPEKKVTTKYTRSASRIKIMIYLYYSM